MPVALPPRTSFIVAHRAGNDVERLRRAEQAGVGLVEADVRLFRGRLEVRHLKTVGPVPLLWDTWTVAPPWTPRLLLGDLLATAAPETELMLDLKGRDPRLAPAVARALREQPRASVTVCSRSWRLLEPLRDEPAVRVVHSVGSERQLAALLRRIGGTGLQGVSIHKKLLDPAITARLRARTELVMAWPVLDLEEGRRLAALGVTGVISDRFEQFIRPRQAAPT